ASMSAMETLRTCPWLRHLAPCRFHRYLLEEASGAAVQMLPGEDGFCFGCVSFRLACSQDGLEACRPRCVFFWRGVRTAARLPAQVLTLSPLQAREGRAQDVEANGRGRE